MRIKFSFVKAQGGKNGDTIPLHHQRILFSIFRELIGEQAPDSTSLCFSSLKGTSKVMKGQVRFLSSKMSLVVSSPEDDLIEELVKKIFSKGEIDIGKFGMIPKSYQVISEPQFNTVMKYICISPIVPTANVSESMATLDPTSHEFSDCIYDVIINSMEKAGYSESQLNDFAEFEITPDAFYMEKIQHSPKKYARIYKTDKEENIMGYLFPFTIHAHPEVQKFIWQRGLGLYTNQGYGMLDTVPESPAVSEHIVP
jgi:CRISPR-associated endoribonuclease Cas6